MTHFRPTVHIEAPLMCSQGGIAFNKAHLDARDAEIDRLRDVIERDGQEMDRLRAIAVDSNNWVAELQALLRSIDDYWPATTSALREQVRAAIEPNAR